MGIERQFVLAYIVENSHFSIPHHDQLLFLKGVQPAHKDVGPDPARKIHCGHGDIRHRLLQIIASAGKNAFRGFIQEHQNH